MTRAYLSLGCNLGDCRRTLAEAVRALDADSRNRVTRVSSLYLTEPVGGVDQPDFLNMALELETELPPEPLLQLCRAIENGLGGREGRRPTGPRTIDIDILLHGRTRMSSDGLQIPHPQMTGRAFVLEPLVEIAPDVVIPGNGKAKEALAVLDDRHRVERTGRLKELEQ